MKSYALAFLPLAGLASAVHVHPRVAHVHPRAGHVHPRAESSSCASRKTVTATVTEKVYTTVNGIDASTTSSAASTSCAGSTKTIDVTSTSTIDITVTVTVRPSTLPPYNNATTSALRKSASIVSNLAYPTPIVLPSSNAQSSTAYSSAVQSQMARPSSASQAPPSSSSPAAAPPAQQPTSPSAESKKGEATFYGGNIEGGTCSFKGYTLPAGIYGTALSDSNWNGASNCGACLSVTGPNGNKITAMVVDECPGCGLNHLDLFPDAFAKLDNPTKGIIPVSWEVVPCGISEPITLKNKEGTSKDWFSMQVLNANTPVSKLEVSTDGGNSWKPTTRKDYNFFESQSGFGTQSVDVKVTGANGKSVVVKGVDVKPLASKLASMNLS